MRIAETRLPPNALESPQSQEPAHTSSTSKLLDARNKLSAWELSWAALILVCYCPNAFNAWLSTTSFSWNQVAMPCLALPLLCAGAVATYRRAKALPQSQSWLGVALAIISAMVCCASQFLHLDFTNKVALTALTANVILAARGRKFLAAFIPTLLFSGFLFPAIPSELFALLSLPLQVICTKLVAICLSPFIPISSHGHLFEIKGELYDVEPGCSGLSMVTTLIFAILLWGMFRAIAVKRYCILFVATPAIAVGLNALRLVVTAVIGYATTQTQALAIHTNIEALLLPLGLILLFKLVSADKDTVKQQ